MTTGKHMNATDHTRYYFDHGGMYHAIAGIYLGYREAHYGHLRSSAFALWTGLLMLCDWLNYLRGK